jgi:NADPH2:quinone reductase
MKAMVITAFGGPEVLAERELPKPRPGRGQLLVRVKATSVNPVDAKIRAAGAWAGVVPPAIIGYDVAGVVEAAGEGAKRFAPGDAVFYTPEIFGSPGSYAEYHVVDEAIVAAMPANLSFDGAAALPLAGCTALDAVVGFAKVASGESVLVHAGAGGVGSLAIQMAAAAGARVLATVSERNADLVRDLGAEPIDYREGPFEAAVLAATGGKGVDFAYDTVGGDTLARSVAVVRAHGKLASIVGTTGDLGAAYGRNLTVYFGFLERSGAKMESLRLLAERKLVRPVIDSRQPLSRVAEAHRRLEAGGVRGKIVLEVA